MIAPTEFSNFPLDGVRQKVNTASMSSEKVVDNFPKKSVVKERPILFSAPMVRAILEGRKVQTRRVVKPQPTCFSHVDWPDDPNFRPSFNADGSLCCAVCMGGDQRLTAKDVTGIRNPYGKSGDRLWVRETFGVWRKTSYECDEFEVGKEATRGLTLVEHEKVYGHSELRIAYRADADDEGPWYPSIFMPRWASRLTLEITQVRVQRLQEIGEGDAVAEGIQRNQAGRGGGWYLEDGEPTYGYATSAFRDLWGSINGADSWDANPWMWALTFKAVKRG